MLLNSRKKKYGKQVFSIKSLMSEIKEASGKREIMCVENVDYIAN